MTKIFAASMIAASVLFLGTNARANTVSVYTSAAEYATAGGAGIAYSFPAIGGTQSCPAVPSYSSGNLNFTEVDSYCIYNDGYYGAQEYMGFGDSGEGTLSTSVDPVSGNLGNSLAFYLGSFDSPQTIAVSVNGATAFDFAIPMAPTDEFFGITSTDAITDVTFTHVQELDFATVPNGVTPEPSSLILFGSGALTMAAAVRRRVKR